MMDENDFIDLIQGCKTLKYKFHGVFAANNFPEKMNRKSSLFLMQQLLKILAPTGYFYAVTINFCLPITLFGPFHRTNTYIKESFLLATITISINSWRINQFKVQTLNFVDCFVFILLIVFIMLKNL